MMRVSSAADLWQAGVDVHRVPEHQPRPEQSWSARPAWQWCHSVSTAAQRSRSRCWPLQRQYSSAAQHSPTSPSDVSFIQSPPPHRFPCKPRPTGSPLVSSPLLTPKPKQPKDKLWRPSVDADAFVTSTTCCDLDLWPPNSNQVISRGYWDSMSLPCSSHSRDIIVTHQFGQTNNTKTVKCQSPWFLISNT